jgi:hypothetical protein
MTDGKHKAYERLKDLVKEADSASQWGSSGKFTEWQQNVHAALRRLYGDDSNQLKAFNSTSYSLPIFTDVTPESAFQEAFIDGIRHAQAIIRSAIQEFEDYELPGSKGGLTTGVAHKSPNAGERIRRIFIVHGHDTK